MITYTLDGFGYGYGYGCEYFTNTNTFSYTDFFESDVFLDKSLKFWMQIQSGFLNFEYLLTPLGTILLLGLPCNRLPLLLWLKDGDYMLSLLR